MKDVRQGPIGLLFPPRTPNLHTLRLPPYVKGYDLRVIKEPSCSQYVLPLQAAPRTFTTELTQVGYIAVQLRVFSSAWEFRGVE